MTSGRPTGSRRTLTAAAIGVVVATAALTVVTAAPAGAATFIVTTTDDVTDAVDGQTSLREAVVAATASPADDTIMLGAATYDLDDCVAGELVTDGSGGDLTIEGGGATIHQTCDATRILSHATSGSVIRLEDVDLIGSPNTTAATIQGAAIAASSVLVLDGVMITDVDAGPGGSVVEFDFGPPPHDVELIDTTITGNVGSAVVNTSNPSGLRAEGSTITSNSGAGISIGDGSPVDIVDTEISGNLGYGVFTTGQGFGLNPIITIAGSQISDNGRGGFACRNGCRSLTVTDSEITDNGAAATADQGGGVEFVTFQEAPVTPSVTVTNSTISDNFARHDGGGLLVEPGLADGDPDPIPITITNSVVDGNDADCMTCRGGGIAAMVGSLSIVGSTVSGNTATDDGGGIHHTRSASDTASVDATFTADQTTVSGNTAGGDGGGISSGLRTQSVTATRVTANTAGGIGGGIHSYGVQALSGASTMNLTGSTVDGNAATDGGGIAVTGGSLTDVVNSTVTANTATGFGGGFAVNLLTSLDLLHATVSANTAPSGANLATSEATSIDRSVIAGPLGGGDNCSSYTTPLMPITSVGRSWFDDDSCEPAATDTVTPGGDPGLGALVDNGGPTPTRLPADGSPLVGLVPPASCSVTLDQRGIARPQGPACEPGSVEVVGSMPAPLIGTPGPDLLVGTPGDDEIIGLEGVDGLFGLDGADILRGGPGHDLLVGGPGPDELIGGPGFDVLIGDASDTLDGGPGLDLCIVPDASPHQLLSRVQPVPQRKVATGSGPPPSASAAAAFR